MVRFTKEKITNITSWILGGLIILTFLFFAFTFLIDILDENKSKEKEINVLKANSKYWNDQYDELNSKHYTLIEEYGDLGEEYIDLKRENLFLEVKSDMADKEKSGKFIQGQFLPSTSEYVIQFDIINGDLEYIYTTGDVDIDIVDGAGKEYYSETHSVDQSSHVIRQNLLGELIKTHQIRIDADEIDLGGGISNGLYAKIIYKTDSTIFEELTIAYLYN